MEKITKETAPIDLLCDKCQQEVHTGDTYFADNENAKIYCTNCDPQK